MKDISSDNDSRSKYHTLQPVKKSNVNSLLKKGDVGSEYHHLHDNWDREKNGNRTEVIDNLVEAIHWISDGNSDLIREMLRGSKILNEWKGDMGDVDDLIKKFDEENEGRHYSRYPEDREADDGNDDDSDDDSGSKEQVHRDRSKRRTQAMKL